MAGETGNGSFRLAIVAAVVLLATPFAGIQAASSARGRSGARKTVTRPADPSDLAPKGPSMTFREEDVPDFEPVGDGDPHVGRIEIPRVGVSSPILEGVDYVTIRRAVGHFPETPMPDEGGNTALAAHRTTDFRGLRHIRLGDEITLSSSQRSFRYVVERTWVVTPDEVWVLDPTQENVLTLVTCYPFDYRGSAPLRFVVRARAVDPQG